MASRGDELMQSAFAALGEILKSRAEEHPEAIAISDERERLSWREFDSKLDRIAAQSQADGVKHGDVIAVAGHNSVGYGLVYCAAVRIGVVAAVLTTSATADSIAAMLSDCGATHLFLDAPMAEKLKSVDIPASVKRIAYDDSAAGTPLSQWMAPEGARPTPAQIKPSDRFNIIYSSGTTGAPKGIVQSHAMRMGHIRRAALVGYMDPTAVTIISTPMYSNTTLVSFIPALAGGGRVVVMGKFDARRFVETAARERVTHAMLVPVQYQRIMALPDFDSFDLSAFRYKSCTSAPFSTALKADVLKRWPGRLIDIYGMTEGGGTCFLDATTFPHKLHTVGVPSPGHDIRLIGEDGKEVAKGEIGEVVGRSETMMNGYHGLDAKTREAEWYDADGNRYIRHGDIGRFDEDGFLVLMDRAKDMIISGGFNVYPSDLEAELRKHPAVADVAVVGMPSEQWGETPVAFVVLRDATADANAIMADVNSRLGGTQRVSAIHVILELPRNQIGKVLKRELREQLAAKV